MKKALLLALFGLLTIQTTKAQCSTCTPNVPTGLPLDTIYLQTPPDATLGVYYDQVVNFRLPLTTDGIPNPPISGVTIDQIVINSISGLSTFGLNYSLSATTFVASPRDGCIHICGMPTQAGAFPVSIDITATIFGSITQPFSYSLPFTVLDPNSIASPLTGCAPLAVTFNSKPASTPESPVSYAWNFGDGTTSNLENPPIKTYSVTGTYPVSLTSTISRYQLTAVSVASVTGGYCNDAGEILCNCGTPVIGQCPDLYFKVSNSSGGTVYDGSSAVVNDVPSANFSGLAVNMLGAPCFLKIYDDEALPIDPDDRLDSLQMTLAVGTHNFTGTNTSGTYTIALVVESTETYTENIVVNDCTGTEIAGLQTVNLDIYPNPTSGAVQVNLGLNVALDVNLDVYNIVGNRLMSRSYGKTAQLADQLDLGNLPAGIYQIRINAGGYNITRRIVVE